MTYQETCDYLFKQTPSFEKSGKTGFNEGLATTLVLDQHYGHPHQQFKTIHVAGTNGKGSVSHTLAAQLQAQGFRVGLYTSPHLVDFRERIRVNGSMIPEKEVVTFVEDFLRWSQTANIKSPSFFELTTAMAFCYFAKQQIDVAVVEVGLGGRLDCTNIITPILSVITNISLDHTDMLGDTLAKIASEKAGIIKKDVPVVIGEVCAETRPVFEKKAKELNAPIVFADESPLLKEAQPLQNGGLSYETNDGTLFCGDLSGLYQQKNTNTALHAIHQLIKIGFINHIDYSAFEHVSESTGLMARWQTLQTNPTIVCDTGHNTGGWQYLSQQLKGVCYRQMRIVFGMVSDKDVSTVMTMLPKHAVYYFTKASTHRAIPEERIMQIGTTLGLHGRCFPTVKEAAEAAVSEAAADDFIFIGGSTYVVSDYMTARVAQQASSKVKTKMEKNSKIYVAGHRGMVGSAIVRELQRQGYTNIITRTHKELDLTRQAEVEKFFAEEKPEYVFLAAAKVGGIVANQSALADFMYENMILEMNVIHAAWKNGCKKLEFLGSSCIYPRMAPQPMPESCLLTSELEKTNEAYALAKISGLKYCEFLNRQYGTDYISVMPTNLYGPNDNYHPEHSHVLPALIRRFHEAKVAGLKEVTCWGDGSPLREFLYVDDLANLCVFLMNNYSGNETVNAGTGKELTIKALTELVAKVVGYEGDIKWDTTRPNGTPRKLLDVSKAERLGWKYKTELEDGIRLSYGDFLNNPMRAER